MADAPLASGQCLLIRALEPWAATKGGQKGNKGPSSQGYGFSSGHVWM